MSRSKSKEALDTGSTGKAEVKKETSIDQVEEPRTGLWKVSVYKWNLKVQTHLFFLIHIFQGSTVLVRC